MFTAITRIIARAVFTVFSTSNLICAQIHWVLKPLFTRSTAATYELFLASSQVPPFACYGVAGHPLVTDRQSRFRIVAPALGEFSALAAFSVLG
jgi:hypothetical protein